MIEKKLIRNSFRLTNANLIEDERTKLLAFEEELNKLDRANRTWISWFGWLIEDEVTKTRRVFIHEKMQECNSKIEKYNKKWLEATKLMNEGMEELNTKVDQAPPPPPAAANNIK